MSGKMSSGFASPEHSGTDSLSVLGLCPLGRLFADHSIANSLSTGLTLCQARPDVLSGFIIYVSGILPVDSLSTHELFVQRATLCQPTLTPNTMWHIA
eukprot:7090504-Karenia_brevis.AAC.1